MSTPDSQSIDLKTPHIDHFGTIEQPTSAQAVADLLRLAADRGSPVVPIGGGGALGLGNRTPANALGLSLAGLDKIIDYQPTDMTLSVQAGARLADVAAVLAEHGQMIPIEAPNSGQATIGGLLATALTGPRRYGGGSLRDVIIGIEVAYPDGTLGKAGGLVVKNVSGFDIMRIHHGALGTLGVITSANFKVLAKPRMEFSTVQSVPSLTDVARIVTFIRPVTTRPVALVVRHDGDSWQIAARYEGRESGLRAVSEAVSGQLDVATRRDGQDSVGYWTTLMDGRAMTNRDEIRIRVGTSPGRCIAVAKEVHELGAQSDTNFTRFEIEPGIGQITASWCGESSAAGVIARIRSSLPESTITVLTAPDAVKAEIDVWGPAPETFAIMQRLKHEFDPGSILNRGRFTGMI